MEKVTAFKWAWGDHEPQADKFTTRHRAAALLRAWRRSKTQGSRNFSLSLIRAHGCKFYRVSTTKYRNEDTGVLVIPFK